MMIADARKQLQEFFRYVIKGVVATVIHYSPLTFNLKISGMPPSALAKIVAATFSIAVAFLFPHGTGTLLFQSAQFGSLYGTIVLLHGAVIYLWTYLYSFNYTIDFIIVYFVCILEIYIGNKVMEFCS